MSPSGQHRLVSFSGFDPGALAFLRGLERNNDRAWFTERKAVYERAVREPMRAFVDAASADLGRAKIPIYGTAERSIFRIYRDVRFSPDKSPYRTHVAAYLSRDGERDTPGGMYVHVAPRGAFLAATFYRMVPAVVAAWRRSLAEEPRAFSRILRAIERSGFALQTPDRGDALVRMPRGFEAFADAPHAEYLRWRSFSVHRELTRNEITSRGLLDATIAFAREMRPFFVYGWSLVDEVDPNDVEEQRRAQKPQRRVPSRSLRE